MRQANRPKPAPRRRRVHAALVKTDDRREVAEMDREVLITGPEAEANVLAAKLAPMYGRLVAWYAKEYGAAADENPKELADGLLAQLREVADRMPPQEVTWRHVSAVANNDLPAALELWEKVKQAAREELAAGVRVVEAIMPNAKPYEQAQLLAVRDEMRDGWNPEGGIEHSLIDMLAANYSLWLYWTALAHRWTTGFVSQSDEEARAESRGWKPPRVYEADAVEQAHRLADSYNRQFLRVLRQLRDLRRYAPPVIVNNGGQVNVANQQVNVSTGDKFNENHVGAGRIE